MIRCLIVDDELPAREELKYILSKSNKVKVIGEASHGLEALELIRKTEPDVVFLDIQMPQMRGIDVARKVLEEDHIPMIIFVTAYDEFAIEAFEVNAIDYLLKPISEERLYNRIEKIYSMKNNEEINSIEQLNKLIKDMKSSTPSSRISVYFKNKLIPIDTNDIIYSTVENKTTVIITPEEKYETNYSLSELHEKLDPEIFFRTHKSYILNLNFIESIEPWFNSTYNINLKNSKEIVPVSRNYAKKFKEIMNID